MREEKRTTNNTTLTFDGEAEMSNEELSSEEELPYNEVIGNVNYEEIAESLVGKLTQVIRAGLTNPYDVLGDGNIDTKAIKKFKEKISERNFIYYDSKNLPYLNQLLPKIGQYKGIEIPLEKDIGNIYKVLKVAEMFYRTEDEFTSIQIMKYLTDELRTRIVGLTERLEKENNPNRKEEILEKLRRTQRIEETLTEIIEWRHKKLEKIKTILAEKDEVVKEFIDTTGLKKFFKRNANIPMTKKELELFTLIHEKLDAFMVKLSQEVKKQWTKEWEEETRRELLKDQRVKKFLEDIKNPVEREKLINTKRGLLFLKSLLELDKEIRGAVKDFRLNLNFERESLIEAVRRYYEKKGVDKAEEIEFLIKGLKEDNIKLIRNGIKAIEDNRLRENLERHLQILSLTKGLERENFFFTKEYRLDLVNRIDKFFNYATKTHQRLLEEIKEIYNFDTLLEKIRAREISYGQVEAILNNKKLINLSDKLTEPLKELVKEQLQEGRKPYEFYLNPEEYRKVLKETIERKNLSFLYVGLKYGLSNEELRKRLKELGLGEMGRVKNFEEFKKRMERFKDDVKLNYVFLTTVLMKQTQVIGGRGISQQISECIEKRVLKGEAKLSECYKKVFQEEKRKVENLENWAKHQLNQGFTGIFYSPLSLTVLIIADLKKAQIKSLINSTKLSEEHLEKILEKYIFVVDDEKRDLGIRKEVFRDVGIWSQITEKNFVSEVKDKIYANLLKDKILELAKKEEYLDLTIEKMAREKVERIDNLETFKEILAIALKTKDKELSLTMLKGLNEVLNNEEIQKEVGKEWVKNVKGLIKDAVEEMEREGLPIKPYEEYKVAEVINQIANLPNVLKGKANKEEILNIFRSELKEVNLKGFKHIFNSEKEKITQILERELKDYIPKSPLELLTKVREINIMLNKYQFDLIGKGSNYVDTIIGKVEEYLDNLKQNTLVLEGEKKSLILLFKDLSKNERRELNEQPSKFLAEKLGVSKKELIEKINSGIFLHGLEYNLLFEKEIKKQVFKEVAKHHKPKI